MLSAPALHTDIQHQVARQIGHWSQAALRLENLDELASPQAWTGLEKYTGTTIRSSLSEALQHLRKDAQQLEMRLKMAQHLGDYQQLQQKVDLFRKRYLKTETTLDFYADAINSRTNQEVAALLTACDRMAFLSMHHILQPMNKTVPPVLTYIDKGLGASILKAGLRLWNKDTINPVAAIKVVRHNLLRPTSLIHEAGHQVAHILNWNEELSHILDRKLQKHSSELAEVWASWSSEIAADTFAFVHTGFGSITALHDVLSGDDRWVFRYLPMDPHPISFIRVLLGTAFCQVAYGRGTWDRMAKVWLEKHPLTRANREVRMVVKHSLPILPFVANLCLNHPKQAFQNRRLVDLVSPNSTHPKALLQMGKDYGPSLYTSSQILQKEALRILALNGLQIANEPHRTPELLRTQRAWMIQLGKHLL